MLKNSNRDMFRTTMSPLIKAQVKLIKSFSVVSSFINRSNMIFFMHFNRLKNSQMEEIMLIMDVDQFHHHHQSSFRKNLLARMYVSHFFIYNKNAYVITKREQYLWIIFIVFFQASSQSSSSYTSIVDQSSSLIVRKIPLKKSLVFNLKTYNRTHHCIRMMDIQL